MGGKIVSSVAASSHGGGDLLTFHRYLRHCMGENSPVGLSQIKLTEALKARSHCLRHLDADTYLQPQRGHTPMGYTSH